MRKYDGDHGDTAGDRLNKVNTQFTQRKDASLTVELNFSCCVTTTEWKN